MSATRLGVVGPADEPFAGRAWVRTFPGGFTETLYRGGDGPGEVERLREWLLSDGIDIGRFRLRGFGSYSSGTPVEADQADQADQADKNAETNHERAARRAKQKVRWLVKALGADHMLTLTYRENLTDYAESKKHFRRFIAMCRREWSEFKYVACPEPQERGAWHWHVAVKGFVNYDKLRGFWWRALGERVAFSGGGKPVLLDHPNDSTATPGNVQGVHASSRGRRVRTWQSDKLASYLGKYVGKNIGLDGIDGASYSATRGLTWKTERYAVRALTFEGVVGAVFDLLASSGAVAPLIWQSPDRRVLWVAARSGEPPPGPL